MFIESVLIFLTGFLQAIWFKDTLEHSPGDQQMYLWDLWEEI